jgi:hypothetical protein
MFVNAKIRNSPIFASRVTTVCHSDGKNVQISEPNGTVQPIQTAAFCGRGRQRQRAGCRFVSVRTLAFRARPAYHESSDLHPRGTAE